MPEYTSPKHQIKITVEESVINFLKQKNIDHMEAIGEMLSNLDDEEDAYRATQKKEVQE